jgi:hypothetical protein
MGSHSVSWDHKFCQICTRIDIERLFKHPLSTKYQQRQPLWPLRNVLDNAECEFCSFLAAKVVAVSGQKAAKNLLTSIGVYNIAGAYITLAIRIHGQEFRSFGEAYSSQSLYRRFVNDDRHVQCRIILIDAQEHRKTNWRRILPGNDSTLPSPRRFDIAEDLTTHLRRLGVIVRPQPEDGSSPSSAFRTSAVSVLPASSLFGVAEPVAPYASLHPANEWVDACSKKHSKCKSHDESAILVVPKRGFMLIDVADQCVIESRGNESPRYLSLSYVWGEVQQPMLLQSNFNLLTRPGALLTLELPRTIRDAMTVTSRLGERYLWVDSLCIVQDEIRHRRREIWRMHSIYHGSLLTIVAAAGVDCNHGLVGVSVARMQQTSFTTTLSCGAKLTLSSTEGEVGPRNGSISLDHWRLQSVSDSTWRTRGWTFQEDICSRRKLIFTESMMIFVCHQEIRREDLGWPVLVMGTKLTRSFSTGTPSKDFEHILNEFLGRHLKRPEDRLNAFIGVHHFISPSLGPLLHGLPRRYFLEALQWTGQAGLCRRPGYPSWSWTGWENLKSYKIGFRTPRGSLFQIDGPDGLLVHADQSGDWSHDYVPILVDGPQRYYDSRPGGDREKRNHTFLYFSTSHAKLRVVPKEENLCAVMNETQPITITEPHGSLDTVTWGQLNGLPPYRVKELTTINGHWFGGMGSLWMDFIVFSYSYLSDLELGSYGSRRLGLVLMMVEKKGECFERICLSNTLVSPRDWNELGPCNRRIILG